MRFVIRSPRPDELEPLAAELYEAYLDNMLRLPLPRPEAEALAENTIRKTVLASKDSEQVVVLVVEDTDRGQMAAAAAINVAPAFMAVYCLYVHVRKEYQGLGALTRKIARHIEGIAREKNLPRLELAVLFSDDRTRRIYDRLGFSPYGALMSKRVTSE